MKLSFHINYLNFRILILDFKILREAQSDIEPTQDDNFRF